MRRLILKSFQSPGDVVMLTAAVRDLHAAYPGQFQTDIRTAAPALWENSPHLTPLREGEPGVELLDMHYPLIHQSNQRPYHFLHGYAQYLEQRLNLQIPVTRFHGDIHLTEQEKQVFLLGNDLGIPKAFWIMVAGGKYDFTAKWWDPACFQQVVDHFRGRIVFVQCGEQGHWHPRLEGVVDLVGKTSLRNFIRLMYHADGVVCPVTFAMHLAAAVETKPGKPKNRACVVVAGGREPSHWEAYPHHQFLSSNGALRCCADGGCWKSRCQVVGDGDDKDRHDLCEQPVQVTAELRIPRCLHLITPKDVIRRIQVYYDGGALSYASDLPANATAPRPFSPETLPRQNGTPHPHREGQETLRVLFLDDRQTRAEEFVPHYPGAVVVQTANQAIEHLKQSNDWDLAFLDHDLNDECHVLEHERDNNHGLAVARWIAENRPRIGAIVVHSTNAQGAKAMTDCLQGAGYGVRCCPFKEGAWKSLEVPETPRPTTNILLKFPHGLGDAVQLTVVLRHLRHYHPDWDIDVAAQVGKHSAYHGLCRRSLRLDRDPPERLAYDQTYTLDWHECRTAYPNWPSTKATRCLQEVFRLTPIPELCSYRIRCGQRARELARRYLETICRSVLEKTSPICLNHATPNPLLTREQGSQPSPCAPLFPHFSPNVGEGSPKGERGSAGRFPAVLIHYQGNTSGEHKDLPHDLVREVCAVVLHAGFVPVILDWDRRSPLADNVSIHNPDVHHELWAGTGTGDAEVLAALIEASSLLIGVDSGPLHVAGATTTPTVAVWTGHHPVHFFDLADNVLHLVPEDHEKLAAGREALLYFADHYRHRTYRQLLIELPALVESHLTGEDVDQLTNKRLSRQLNATSFGERYYQEHKLAGLDYLGFGDWQERYGRWLVESLGLKGQRVLDVGCACGALLRGLGQAGAVVQGVEVNEYMVRLGREKWPDMAGLLLVCDAVNLHLFGDASWDAIHTAQVAEHWKPELVPLILRELGRISVPGGLLFCCLDTEELFARQGRRLEAEDPTHVCIRPMTWWHDQLADAGWQVCSGEFEGRLRDHPDSFLKRYDWDWFLARKPVGPR